MAGDELCKLMLSAFELLPGQRFSLPLEEVAQTVLQQAHVGKAPGEQQEHALKALGELVGALGPPHQQGGGSCDTSHPGRAGRSPEEAACAAAPPSQHLCWAEDWSSLIFASPLSQLWEPGISLR